MGEDAQISSQFLLNVGGVIFPMAAGSFGVEPDSMLTAMFSHGGQCQPSEKDGVGAFLIHRSPVMFGYSHRHMHNMPLNLA